MGNEKSHLPAVRTWLGRTLALSALGLLVACAGAKPFEYTEIHEIPPGPGLFSGSDGAFTIGFGGKTDPESPEAKGQEQN